MVRAFGDDESFPFPPEAVFREPHYDEWVLKDPVKIAVVCKVRQ